MEAAWDGNLDKIRSLTLRTDPDDIHPRLLISIQDDHYNCPFSLAFFRGHRGVAAAILDIVKTQWAPNDGSNQSSRRRRLRWRTRTPSYRGSGSLGRSEMELDSGDDPSQLGPIILSEDEDNMSVDEDIVQESKPSTSNATPMRILRQEWQMLHLVEGKWEPGLRQTLFESCVSRNDVAGLEVLIKLAQYWTSQMLPDDPVEEVLAYHDPTEKKEQDGIFTLSEAEFQTLLNEGNLELVHLVMRKIGAGLILDDLVRRSGENLEQKSEFYQGLTVYGKKRRVTLSYLYHGLTSDFQTIERIGPILFLQESVEDQETGFSTFPGRILIRTM